MDAPLAPAERKIESVRPATMCCFCNDLACEKKPGSASVHPSTPIRTCPSDVASRV
jgi:hypothetical protein